MNFDQIIDFFILVNFDLRSKIGDFSQFGEIGDFSEFWSIWRNW